MNDLTSPDHPESDSQTEKGDTVMIPLPTVADVEFMPFQKFRCYGVDVEFPKNRVPFQAQRSVMTLVIVQQ